MAYASATPSELMLRAETDELTYKTFPQAHWRQIHSIKPLERLNKDIERRTNVVCIFPNEPAIKRLVCAPMLKQNDEAALTRHYMTLETVAAIYFENDGFQSISAGASLTRTVAPHRFDACLNPQHHGTPCGQAKHLCLCRYFYRYPLIALRVFDPVHRPANAKAMQDRRKQDDQRHQRPKLAFVGKLDMATRVAQVIDRTDPPHAVN